MQLQPLQKSHTRAFRHLYRAAFPACERQSFSFLLRQQKKGLSQLYCAVDEAGAFLGLAVLVARDDLVMINYLAVAEAARGGGLGSAMLTAVRDLCPGKRIVLEIETPRPDAPADDLRHRRQAFYERNGYVSTGVRLHIGGNDMTLLSLGGHVSFEAYCALQKHALGDFIWKRLNVYRRSARSGARATAFTAYQDALPPAQAAALADFFEEVSRHVFLSAAETADIRADFENALLHYHGIGVPLEEALELLRVAHLGGFYARPPIVWYPLDDAAKIYPMSMKHGQMAVFRLSVYLTAPVVPALLQMALTFSIKRFPSFATTVKKGFFWHYLDTSKHRFAAMAETDPPCSPLPIAHSGSQSLRVLYHQNRISVEYFHVLTDGTGGMTFLKALLGEYLRLSGVAVSYTDGVWDPDETPARSETANEFPRAPRTGSGSFLGKPATQMSGRLSAHRPCQVLHLRLDAARLSATAKAQGATVTAYLLAQLFLATKFATDEPGGMACIQVPVNMRKYYPSDTVRNFAMYCSVDLPLDAITCAADMLPSINAQLREKAAKDAVSALMRATAQLVSSIRYIPLFIKAPVARMVYGFLGDQVISNTLSNLGVVTLPTSFAPHVRSMDFVLGTVQANRAACALVTCGEVATLSISKMTADPSFEERLWTLLQDDGLVLAVEGSELYET